MSAKPRKEPSRNDVTRSSAAEYLTFVAASGSSEQSVEMRYEDENIWLTQKMMTALYDVTLSTINGHLIRLQEDGELNPDSVIRKFRISAADGKSYNTKHYNLQSIMAVGFKIENPRAVQFRKWAGEIVKSDVSIAKDYLSNSEIDSLNRIVQDRLVESDFDRFLALEKALENVTRTETPDESSAP